MLDGESELGVDARDLGEARGELEPSRLGGGNESSETVGRGVPEPVERVTERAEKNEVEGIGQERYRDAGVVPELDGHDTVSRRREALPVGGLAEELEDSTALGEPASQRAGAESTIRLFQ